VKLGELWLCSKLFEEIACLELLSSFCDDSSLTYHSAVTVTAVMHTDESCRNLFAQENQFRVLTNLQFWLLCSVSAMPVNKMLLQELNQFNRN